MTDEQEVLTVSIPEAGRLLGNFHRNTAYRLAKEGVIPTVQIGGKARVPKAALHKMLEIPQKENTER